MSVSLFHGAFVLLQLDGVLQLHEPSCPGIECCIQRVDLFLGSVIDHAKNISVIVAGQLLKSFPAAVFSDKINTSTKGEWFQFVDNGLGFLPEIPMFQLGWINIPLDISTNVHMLNLV